MADFWHDVADYTRCGPDIRNIEDVEELDQRGAQTLDQSPS